MATLFSCGGLSFSRRASSIPVNWLLATFALWAAPLPAASSEIPVYVDLKTSRPGTSDRPCSTAQEAAANSLFREALRARWPLWDFRAAQIPGVEESDARLEVSIKQTSLGYYATFKVSMDSRQRETTSFPLGGITCGTMGSTLQSRFPKEDAQQGSQQMANALLGKLRHVVPVGYGASLAESNPPNVYLHMNPEQRPGVPQATFYLWPQPANPCSHPAPRAYLVGQACVEFLDGDSKRQGIVAAWKSVVPATCEEYKETYAPRLQGHPFFLEALDEMQFTCDDLRVPAPVRISTGGTP